MQTDCSTMTTKKACKDCTCGRAEAEAAGVKVELTSEMLENPQSACGSVSIQYGSSFLCIIQSCIVQPTMCFG